MRHIFLFVISFAFFGSIFAAETLSGKIVGVTDGDTVKLLTADKREVKLRLYGVDAPEKAQAFGQKAKQFSSELVFGKEAQVEVIDKDRYGRSVGLVRVGQGSATLNERLVESGFGWLYAQYCKKEPLCSNLAALEKDARAKKRGLWADTDPTPPWQWRKDKKGKGKKAGVGEDGAEPDLYQDMIKKKDEAVDKANRDHEQEQKVKKQEGMQI